MRIFLSAVSPDFESARDRVANGLQAKGHQVEVQRTFRQGNDPSTTLRKLHDYIRNCDAVICLVGTYSADYPPETAEFLRHEMLPDGIDRASYTRWEIHFARHYGKRLHIYLAGDAWQPDREPSERDEPMHQRSFVQYIKQRNLDRTYFNTPSELGEAVFKEDWPNLAGPKPNNLPFHSLGSLFKGRKEFLNSLRDKLCSSSGHAAAITTKPQAVHGAGGIGKTRAAIEFAWQNERDYSALLFLTAESPESLDANLARLTGVLGIEGLESADDPARLAAVLEWLKTHPGWLTILDNVDTDEAAQAVRARLTELRHGHVVITSRISQWSAGVERLDLDVLDLASARDYLLEGTASDRRPTDNDSDDAEQVATDVGQLALGFVLTTWRSRTASCARSRFARQSIRGRSGKLARAAEHADHRLDRLGTRRR